MSTKATIAYGENFHFYHEVMDEDHVYLEIETTHFEAGYGRVMLPIPIHIWETIRHLGGARLDLVNCTDAALLAMVETAVDERILRYQEALRAHPDRAGLMSFAGSLLYGRAEDPRAEQAVRGMEYYRNERQRQRDIHTAIRTLREAQHHATQVLLHLNEPQIAADLLIMLMRHMSQEYFATPWSAYWNCNSGKPHTDSEICSRSRANRPVTSRRNARAGPYGMPSQTNRSMSHCVSGKVFTASASYTGSRSSNHNQNP